MTVHYNPIKIIANISIILKLILVLESPDSFYSYFKGVSKEVSGMKWVNYQPGPVNSK